ncbi:MAG: Uma2 family endonuclease [Saprospiraceae bacterium]
MEVLTKKTTWPEFRDMEFPDGDTAIYELIKGEIVKRASPNTPHQQTFTNLFVELGLYNRQKKLGRLFAAPYDVYLDAENAGIQPDILFVTNERDFIIRNNNGIVGAPDLVVEILSKGTMNTDRGDKKDVYEQFAVREYWIVDPSARSVEVYKMEQNRYRLVSSAREEGTFKSSVLPDFEMDVSLVFENVAN